MAEFKLGRLRFVWKNDWATSTVYYQDDVVQYAGKLYICVLGHTSASDFYADFWFLLVLILFVLFYSKR